MLVKTKTRQSRSLKNLAHEVALLRSLAISVVGQDDEGSYRPEFVKKILQASFEKPTESFVNADDFLRKVERYG